MKKMTNSSDKDKIKFLQKACRRAGKEIMELKDTIKKLEKIIGVYNEKEVR